MSTSYDKCPQCGSTLSYRLGDWECGACGYLRTAPALTAPAASAPTAALPQYQQLLANLTAPVDPGYDRSLGYDPRFEMRGEKRAVVLANLLVNLLPTLLIIGAVVWMQNLDGGLLPPGSSGSVMFLAVVLLFNLAGTAISTAIVYYTLFGDNLTLKGGCLIWNSLALLVYGLALFAPELLLEPDRRAMLAIGDGRAVVLLAVLLSLAFTGWVCSILWRDINGLQRG